MLGHALSQQRLVAFCLRCEGLDPADEIAVPCCLTQPVEGLDEIVVYAAVASHRCIRTHFIHACVPARREGGGAPILLTGYRWHFRESASSSSATLFLNSSRWSSAVRPSWRPSLFSSSVSCAASSNINCNGGLSVCCLSGVPPQICLHHGGHLAVPAPCFKGRGRQVLQPGIVVMLPGLRGILRVILTEEDKIPLK